MTNFYYIDRTLNQKTIPEALAKCLLLLNTLASVLAKQDMKEFTLGKSLTNVNIVTNALETQDT